MSKDLMKLTAVELGKKIKDKEVTVVEATKACLERIKALDETYNCFVTVDEAGALAQAEAIQAKIDSGELTGPLAGFLLVTERAVSPIGVRANLLHAFQAGEDGLEAVTYVFIYDFHNSIS